MYEYSSIAQSSAPPQWPSPYHNLSLAYESAGSRARAQMERRKKKIKIKIKAQTPELKQHSAKKQMTKRKKERKAKEHR